MSDWEDYYQANRQHIEDMMERFCGESRQVRRMSNKAIANGLYKMVLNGEQDDLILAEAAERLAVTETTNMNDARKN